MTERHDDRPAAQLDAARLALYRADADEATRARYEALRERIGGAAPRQSPPIAVGGGAPGRQRTRAATLVIGALILAAVAAAAGTIPLLARGPARQAVLPSGLPLRVALERERSVLPADWQRARIAAASDDLDGATPLRARGRVLLVVHCPAADRSFQAVAGGRTVYGACARPVFLRLDDGARVTVTTRGVLPFSAALLVPDAGS